MTRNTSRLTTGPLAIAALLLGAGGCAALNPAAGLRSDDDLEAISQVERPATLEAPFMLSGHDRRHWKPAVVEVPRLTTQVHPNYGSSDTMLRETPRQRGIYPALPTKGDEQSGGAIDASFSTGPEAGEIILAPLQFLLEAVIAPFQMVVRWPWNVENSPANEFERNERGEPPYAGTWVEPAADAN